MVERLGQAAAEDQAERQHQGPDAEGDPPAEGVELGRGQDVRQQEAGGRAHQRGDRLAGALPGADQAAAAGPRRLDQEGGGRPHLSAERETLHQPAQHQQGRGRRTDHGVGGNQHQTEHAGAHQREAQQHGRLAAHPVADPADHHRAQRPSDEAHREGEQRHHQAFEGGVRGEKGPPQLGSEQGVGGEVVEFERIAHHGGGDLPARDLRMSGVVRRPPVRHLSHG